MLDSIAYVQITRIFFSDVLALPVRYLYYYYFWNNTYINLLRMRVFADS